jgi:hypothetical protein
MKKKKNKTTGLIVAIAVGAALYLFLNRNKPNINPRQFQQIPPRPSTKGEAFNQWALSIYQLYGVTKEMFQPGGIFYKIPKKDIYDVVGTPSWEDYA